MKDSNIITIGQPYICKSDDESKVRLCAEISGKFNEILYYEVDKKYESYLDTERSDAFLLGLLHSAMFENCDVVCLGIVTEQLLFQLSTYYIPILTRNMTDLYSIKINADTTNELKKTANYVCTGNSGGVDSYYTMLKYSNVKQKNYKLTHVMFNNISTADTDENRIRILFEKDLADKKKASDDMGLEFLDLYSNLYNFYSHPGIFNHYFTLQYVSAAYALSGLFSTFYFSSTFSTERFSLSKDVVHSSGRFDLFTIECISTRHLQVYSSGMEVERMDKMRYIADHSVVQRHLQVCSIEQSPGGYEHLRKLNCGHCHKCSRTISILYAFGNLEKYESIFDLSYFYSNKAKFIGKGMASDQKVFADEVMKLLVESKLLPKGTRFWRLAYSFRYALSKNPILVRIYHKVIGKATNI